MRQSSLISLVVLKYSCTHITFENLCSYCANLSSIDFIDWNTKTCLQHCRLMVFKPFRNLSYSPVYQNNNCSVYFSYLDELGRHNYVTPTSYLELISSFKGLLNKKQDEVSIETLSIQYIHVHGLDKYIYLIRCFVVQYRCIFFRVLQ